MKAVNGSLRLLEDYELDHVSGGLDEEAGFIADPFTLPDGYTMENISGVYLEQDLATGVWTAEFVLESNFTDAGYSSTDDSGGGLQPREPVQGMTEAGDDFGTVSSSSSRTTVRTTVTRTSSPSWSIKWNWYGPTITYTSGTSVTETTTTTTTTRSGRLTGSGSQGSLPPPK